MRQRLLWGVICLLSLAGCGSGSDSGSGTPPVEPDRVDSIVITVSSSFFRPAMEFTSDAMVTIDYGDGTPAAEIPVTGVAAGTGLNHVFNSYTFADTQSAHNVNIVVRPWSALKVLNLGFRAADGGNDASGNGLDLIALHPSDSNTGGLDWTEWIRSQVGTVTAVSGLSAATDLYAVCCDHQALTEIDLSGCGKLKTLEAYSAQIKKTNFAGCTSLVRCSIENTGARYSWRIIGGKRVEDASLDLADCGALRDIRGSADDHDMLKLNPGALGTLWHLCKWGNPHFTQVKIGSEAPGKLDPGRFTVLRQLWVGGSPMLGNLVISNGLTDSIWGNNCGITSVDCRGQTQLRTLQMWGDPVTSIDITGCVNLFELSFNSVLISDANKDNFVSTVETLNGLRIVNIDCGLSQAQVDRILSAFNGFAVPANVYSWDSFVLDLSGPNNSSPSGAGLAAASALRAKNIPVEDGSVKHWTVTVNP